MRGENTPCPINARRHGLFCVAGTGGRHDRLGHHQRLADHGPLGLTERIVGINPLGVAIPADREYPIVFDAAFSGSSHGKIRIHQQKNLPLPEGWALDADGQPTIDPARVIDGLLMPIGAFKGVSLALLMGVFSSMLLGAAYGTELGNMENGPQAGLDGHFVMAVNVAAFVEVARFKERVDAAIVQIRQCRRAPGVERLYVAGGQEFVRREEYGRAGIPLNQVTVRDIGATARELGVEVDQYGWLG